MNKIFTILFTIMLFSEISVFSQIAFNEIYFKNSPEFRDLTLEGNDHARAKLQIERIVKKNSFPLKFSDSTYFKSEVQKGNYSLAHIPQAEYMTYDQNGRLVNRCIMPLNFTISPADSIKVNSTKQAVNSTSKNKSYYKTKYSDEGKLISSENFEGEDLLKIAKYSYKKNKIYVTQTCTSFKDSSKYVLKNINWLNKNGQVITSIYYNDEIPGVKEIFTCNYDLNNNLIEITLSHDKKSKKQEILYKYKYTYDKNKIVTLEFISNRGNKFIEFDNFERMTKITNRGSDVIETFEYY